MQETPVQSLGWEDPLEKGMAIYSSTLAWKIPWTEEPGGLQSMGLLPVGHNWVTSLSLSCIGKGNGNPLQCSCLENPRDRGAWWAAVYGAAQSWTRLKRLSSSSSSSRATKKSTRMQSYDISCLWGLCRQYVALLYASIMILLWLLTSVSWVLIFSNVFSKFWYLKLCQTIQRLRPMFLAPRF